MPKLTLSDAIAEWEEVVSPFKGLSYYAVSDLLLILAAAKAFACERCLGTGTIPVVAPSIPATVYVDCPACAEFRRVAREGVEG